MTNTVFNDSQGLTAIQFYSTQSFQTTNLRGIDFGLNDLVGWDFSGQNLSGSSFFRSGLAHAQLSGANLTNANLESDTLSLAVFDSDTVYNQWTVFPQEFDPVAMSLTLVVSPEGDFDASDSLDVHDLELLQAVIDHGLDWLPHEIFNLDFNVCIDQHDFLFWVKDLKQTYFGDANLDGQFNSTGLITVFQVGQYEDAVTGNSTWSTGDWNIDGGFTTSDLEEAFQDGSYGNGPRVNAAVVPEPNSLAWLVIILIRFRSLLRVRHSTRGRSVNLRRPTIV